MYTLTIEPLGEEVAVEEGQTILDACLRAGVWLPHACGHGLCGTCKVDVIDGEVDHRDASLFALLDVEREEGKTLACCATLDSDVEIEADVDEEPDAERHPVRDFTGTVTRLADLTPDIKGVWLAVAAVDGDGDGDGPLAFQAGQYVNVTVPGVDGPRAFSIANPPSQGDGAEIELHIRLVPGGRATTWIHENLAEGDTLAFSGPYGRFFVRASAPEPVIFLAGGSGLSSPKAMVLDLLARGDTRPITLIHGARGPKDLYFKDLFEDLEKEHENFSYLPVLSELPEGAAWDGETGFVHEALQRRFDGVFEGHKAYLCGPPPMVNACITTLMRGRLFEKHIFTEQFLTAADAEPKSRSPLFKRI
ncbi:MAG: 2Fe-2S iron-sulfur cluster binding domain-containing protein [Rhodobacterales bacterium]|nr:2Fe-2S iron-sulfur cluster binding domain-containing protein [Rhodobacterales bacterium]